MFLDDFGVALFEMRCPCCKEIQQLKLRNFNNVLTKCHSCKADLAAQVNVEQKPNAVKISLNIVEIKFPVFKPKADVAKLKKVAV